jgi:hypothetical protein
MAEKTSRWRSAAAQERLGAVTTRLLAAFLAALAFGCSSFGGAGLGGDECLEGDDSHECEEASRSSD